MRSPLAEYLFCRHKPEESRAKSKARFFTRKVSEHVVGHSREENRTLHEEEGVGRYYPVKQIFAGTRILQGFLEGGKMGLPVKSCGEQQVRRPGQSELAMFFPGLVLVLVCLCVLDDD